MTQAVVHLRNMHAQHRATSLDDRQQHVPVCDRLSSRRWPLSSCFEIRLAVRTMVDIAYNAAATSHSRLNTCQHHCSFIWLAA